MEHALRPRRFPLRMHDPPDTSGQPSVPSGEADAPDAPANANAADPRPTWDDVAERYGPTIYSIAHRLTGDPHDAADLAQDVFVRVYRNLHRYQPGTFEGWIYRIAKNLFLDDVRRRRRRRTASLDTEEHGEPPSDAPGPAETVERATLEARLQRALAALPPRYRLAVVLCDVQGLTYEEIAAATGWPMGTVRSRIHRGRKGLRAHLQAEPADQESGW